jgi:putative FmdB family regulatory protein
MPLFEYTCRTGHRFEKLLAHYTPISTTCPKCGKVATMTISVPAKRAGYHGIQR